MKPAARTIPDALAATAERGAGEFVFHLDGGIERFSCAELLERATHGARQLAALDVRPGDAVGLLGPNRPEWVVWAFSTWLAGAVLVPIHIPLRVRDAGAFGDQVRNLVRVSRCRRVVAHPRLAALLDDDVAVGWDHRGDASRMSADAPTQDDGAVIQFTSGSTAAPKGALVSHGAVLAQMDILAEGYHRGEAGDEPRATLSWTPFFHDLGLFASVVQTASAGLVSHHLPTERFARDPVEWLRLVGATGVTATVAPSSAFGSAVRAALRRGESIDLGSLEAAYFAAEGVDPEVVRRMVEMAERLGFEPCVLGSTYGLAEAVLAATHTKVGEGVHVDRISLADLTADGVAAPAGGSPSRLLVCSGRPRMGLRIAGADGDLPERHVGEILLRGPSLMTRYVGDDAPDPFVGGWLRTGDLGYLADGELYVTGRAKDLMISMGRNHYPEDFEWAAARAGSVRPGRCVAFAKPGVEAVVLLVEPSDGQPADVVRREVRRAVADAVGSPPAEVVVLAPGAIEKTTSGKLRRAAMRDAYAAGALGTVGAE